MKIDIAGIRIDKITKKEVLLKIKEFLNQGQHYLATVYSEMIVAGQKDKEFREILNKADLAVPDGIGILWAGAVMADHRSQITDHRPQTTDSRFFKKIRIVLKAIFYLFCIIFWSKKIREVFPERIAGVDLMGDICGFAAQKKYSVFFLGGKEGVAKIAALHLKVKFSDLIIAGYFSGKKEKENDEILRQIINQKKPDILFVAFGPPFQEKWINRNLKYLESVKLAMGVGGSFDYISGTKKRAPKIFQKIGTEWLWRFLAEPSRRRRIINAVIIFPYLIIKSRTFLPIFFKNIQVPKALIGKKMRDKK